MSHRSRPRAAPRLMVERSRIFGTAAQDYERFRPGYPAELVDDVLAYADRPVNTALEIGAGTGKATRAFAARGLSVTATEPDTAMLAELRRHVPTSVETIEAAFEDVPLTATYDLVFAAAALHWTRPDGRWERVARLLAPDGTFASFGGQVNLADGALADAVETARLPFVEDPVPASDTTPGDAALSWPGTELVSSSLFTDVRQSVIERRTTMSASDYLSHLSTISVYLLLPPTELEEVQGRIRAVLPPVVEIDADLTLHLARRR